MCAKVKMLTAINSTVNCTLVLIKHKYSNCIHYRFPLELLLEENRSTSQSIGLTEQSNPYGMVFNSVRRLATSLPQLGKAFCSLFGFESSEQLFSDILLTLRDILNYYCGQVLKTLKQAAYNAPVSCVFFTPKDYLWPSVRLIKDLILQGIRQPSCFGFEPSATSLSKRAVLNQNINKEAIHG